LKKSELTGIIRELAVWIRDSGKATVKDKPLIDRALAASEQRDKAKK
jgi:hypothetical protein